MTRKMIRKAHWGLFTKWFRAYRKVKLDVFKTAKEKQKIVRIYRSNTEQLLDTYPFLDMYEYLLREGVQDIEKADRVSMNILLQMPEGWIETIGFDLCEDILKAAKKDKVLNHLAFTQIKDKFGGLNIDAYPHSKGVEKVLDKYRGLSMCYCLNCGHTTRFRTKGIINYLCPNCFKKAHLDGKSMKHKDELYSDCRLTKKDIPVIRKVHHIGKKSFTTKYKPVKDRVYKKLWELE